jgi:hypothetical protein
VPLIVFGITTSSSSSSTSMAGAFGRRMDAAAFLANAGRRVGDDRGDDEGGGHLSPA